MFVFTCRMLDRTDRFCVICSLNNYFKGMDIINKVRKTPLSSSLQYNGPNKKAKNPCGVLHLFTLKPARWLVWLAWLGASFWKRLGICTAYNQHLVSPPESCIWWVLPWSNVIRVLANVMFGSEWKISCWCRLLSVVEGTSAHLGDGKHRARPRPESIHNCAHNFEKPKHDLPFLLNNRSFSDICPDLPTFMHFLDQFFFPFVYSRSTACMWKMRGRESVAI